MTTWSVNFDTTNPKAIAGLADRLGELIDQLGDDAVAHSSSAGRRYGARFNVDATDPAEAVDAGLKRFRQAVAAVGLPPGTISAAEALTLSELRRQNKLPSYPPLVGVSEIATGLHITAQRVSTLARRADFPEPLARLRSGPIWAGPAVESFAASWERTPGRRPAPPVPAPGVVRGSGHRLTDI